MTDTDISNLEWRVIEAAISARQRYDEYGNAVAHSPEHSDYSWREEVSVTLKADAARRELFAAVDALIAAREATEGITNG